MRGGTRAPGAGELIAGRYRLVRPIGEGAMGTVWEALHELLQRSFAVKFPHVDPHAATDAKERFLREARIVARIRHPNIVDVADVGEHEGAPYLAMELLHGEPLSDRIGASGGLSLREAVLIMAEVAAGLGAAHAAGIVHRDVKPENIFLAHGASGGLVPKLLDFGISKAHIEGDVTSTLSGQFFGTPAYMSPEQAAGALDVDARSDVWSLGVVLYEALSGRQPFNAPSYAALLFRIRETEPEPLDEAVPEPVREVITRCLTKDRDGRYADASAVHEALTEAAHGLGDAASSASIERRRELPPLTDAPPGRSDRPSQSSASRSNRRLIGLGVAGLFLLAAVAIRLHEQSGKPADAQLEAGAYAAPALPATPTSPALEPASERASDADPPAASAPGSAPASAPTAEALAASSTASGAAPRPAAAKRPTQRPVTRVNSAGF